METPIRDRKCISVCCAGCPSDEESKLAYEVGKEIAIRGAILVCGGLSGSMESACRGAKDNGGLTIGILPTYEKDTANKFVDIAIPTGLGNARNNLVVASGDVVIGVGGSWGTLSEIAIAMKMGKKVVVLNGWKASTSGIPDPGFPQAKTASEAVSMVLSKDAG
jgi:uncharacterized protein (TIGR00725 family)